MCKIEKHNKLKKKKKIIARMFKEARLQTMCVCDMMANWLEWFIQAWSKTRTHRFHSAGRWTLSHTDTGRWCTAPGCYRSGSRTYWRGCHTPPLSSPRDRHTHPGGILPDHYKGGGIHLAKKMILNLLDLWLIRITKYNNFHFIWLYCVACLIL